MWVRVVSSAPVRHVIFLAALLVVAVAALAGCGSDDSDSAPNVDATLLLDFQPNAVHTGIYTAIERGYDSALGVNLRARAPGSSTDAVKLLVSGRADLAILDIHDLALAREAGSDLVGVMALVQTPWRRSSPSRRTARRATSRASASASPACRATTPYCARSSQVRVASRTRSA